MPAGRKLICAPLLLLFSACSETSDNCPGLCPDENIPPSMTISTEDGLPTIASAKILSGPCSHILIRSSGEVGVPTTYAAVQVTYNGPRDLAPLCIVELTSRYGQVEGITAEAKATQYQQTCCPYATCCPAASTVTQHRHVEFLPPTKTVSFPPPPDGGAADGALDAAQDAPDAAVDMVGHLDSDDSIDGTSSGIDMSEIDSAMVDSPAFDGAASDVPAPVDLASSFDLDLDA
jgi:hypothetical protein